MNLDHIAIGVSDMEQSLRFYRDILGMVVIHDRNVCDDSIGKVIGVSGAKCRIVHLALENAFLELFEYYEPKGTNIARSLNQYDHAIIHFAFNVENFEETLLRLKENSVDFIADPIEFRPGIWCIYFRGPDGEICAIRHQQK